MITPQSMQGYSPLERSEAKWCSSVLCQHGAQTIAAAEFSSKSASVHGGISDLSRDLESNGVAGNPGAISEIRTIACQGQAWRGAASPYSSQRS